MFAFALVLGIQKGCCSDLVQGKMVHRDFKEKPLKLPFILSVLFRLRDGWVGLTKSEHCSDLENGTLPRDIILRLATIINKVFVLI